MQWLADKINEFAEWLKEMLLWLGRKIAELFLDAFATVIENIPVPDFLQNIGNPFSDLNEGVAFFAESLMIIEGIEIILICYALRFLIRRIPVIG